MVQKVGFHAHVSSARSNLEYDRTTQASIHRDKVVRHTGGLGHHAPLIHRTVIMRNSCIVVRTSRATLPHQPLPHLERLAAEREVPGIQQQVEQVGKRHAGGLSRQGHPPHIPLSFMVLAQRPEPHPDLTLLTACRATTSRLWAPRAAQHQKPMTIGQ